MRVLHQGGEHLLHLRTREVALLLDILEAALPAETISGPRASNPSLSQFFNEIYGQLIDTARAGWADVVPPSQPAAARRLR
ncbi:hypothetical protein NZK32_14465 [Cyanobium sp. FGCU-52]|nr:hypothetical protein [Cyanobium sp. FGCU52]